MNKWDLVEFKGNKRFLSNMYPCNIHMTKIIKKMYPYFEYNEYVFPSSENLYQSLKCANIEDIKLFIDISPIEAKKLGRKIKIKENWDDLKIDAMKICLYLKFSQNIELAKKLKKIEGNIEEKNYWNDTFWGTCRGKGENNLGKLLENIRYNLISQQKDLDNDIAELIDDNIMYLIS